MAKDIIGVNGRAVDLSAREAVSTTVVASPPDNTETIIASVQLASGLTVTSGVRLRGWAAFTVGTNGVSVNLQIRRTTVAGSILVATGATTATAANLGALGVDFFDTSPTDAGIYKLTMTVASGSAPSTVSAVYLEAFAV